VTRPPRPPRLTPTALALAALLLPALGACHADARGAESLDAREAASVTGGDPARAPALMRHYGCVACHTIPGVPGADGLVGPPLTAMASRGYIGGVLPNAPDNMIRWLLDPPAVDSLTAMPKVGLTELEARHIAAYLYTLH
jgi:cytochrome c1